MTKERTLQERADSWAKEALKDMKRELKADEKGEEIENSDYGVNIIKHYEIILGGGGPAYRIYGELDGGEAVTAELQMQDWFQPWTPARLTIEQEGTLLDWVNRFYSWFEEV